MVFFIVLFILTGTTNFAMQIANKDEIDLPEYKDYPTERVKQILEKIKELKKLYYKEPKKYKEELYKHIDEVIDIQNITEKNIVKDSEIKGWYLVRKDTYKDGGSSLYIYEKKQANNLYLLELSIWKSVNSEELFGTINYYTRKYNIPVTFEGFPLKIDVENINEYKRTDSIEGVTFEKEYDEEFGDIDVQLKYFEINGCKMYFSPFLEEGEIIFQKNGKYMKMKKQVVNKKHVMGFTIYSENINIKEKYKEISEVLEKTIVTRGALILNGAFVKPPYEFILKGDTIYINGAFLKKLEFEKKVLEKLKTKVSKKNVYIDNLRFYVEIEFEGLNTDGVKIINEGEASGIDIVLPSVKLFLANTEDINKFDSSKTMVLNINEIMKENILEVEKYKKLNKIITEKRYVEKILKNWIDIGDIK